MPLAVDAYFEFQLRPIAPGLLTYLHFGIRETRDPRSCFTKSHIETLKPTQAFVTAIGNLNALKGCHV